MAKKSKRGSSKASSRTEFSVVFDGIKLTKLVEKRIETEIRKAVMQEVAALDFKGDVTLGPDPPPGGGSTRGMVVR